MINGLGVLGWGVGGIEAEAAMLGQPVSMLIPQVVGFKLNGKLPEGATATDLVLTVTQMLRKKGVVGKFVEFFGAGLAEPAARRPRDDRQHGARVRRDVRHLPGRRRDARATCALTGRRRSSTSRSSRRTARSRGCSTTTDAPEADYTRHARARPRHRRAEPRRPEPPAGPRAAAATSKTSFATRCDLGEHATSQAPRASRPAIDERAAPAATGAAERPMRSQTADRGRRRLDVRLDHGSVVIAAITSCTNTSNPSVMVAAGLLAKKAVETGPQREALGEDEPRARARRSSPTTSTTPG